MIVAFMPLHILLCDEVLLYFVLRVDVIRSLKLNLNQKISEVVVAMKVSRLLVMACKQRFLCEGPPLLGWLGITPRLR
jgi:hypothetical protein